MNEIEKNVIIVYKMSCYGSTKVNVVNCVTTKVKEGCLEVAAKELLPVDIRNISVNVTGCVQTSLTGTMEVTGCVEIKNQEPVGVTGCLQVDNKECDPLCMIVEENIYDRKTQNFLSDADIGISTIEISGIDSNSLFEAEKLSISVCATGSYLSCNNLSMFLGYLPVTPELVALGLTNVPLGQWPGQVNIVDKGNGEFFARLELNYQQVYGCPLTMNNNYSIFFGFQGTDGVIIQKIGGVLSGCVRPKQKDCSSNLNLVLPELEDGSKTICHCDPLGFDLTTLITNQDKLDADNADNAEVTFSWTATGITGIVETIEREFDGSGTVINYILKASGTENGMIDFIVQSKRIIQDMECNGEQATVSVTVLPELVVSINGPTGLCQNTEQIYEAVVNGGTGAPYTLRWFEDGQPKFTGFKINVYPFDSGSRTGTVNLSVVAQDKFGCEGNTSINIEIFEPPSITLDLNRLCFDSELELDFAELCYSATGGQQPYNVELKMGGYSIDSAIGPTGCFTVNTGGYYYAEVTDVHGCMRSSTPPVTVPEDCNGD